MSIPMCSWPGLRFHTTLVGLLDMLTDMWGLAAWLATVANTIRHDGLSQLGIRKWLVWPMAGQQKRWPWTNQPFAMAPAMARAIAVDMAMATAIALVVAMAVAWAMAVPLAMATAVGMTIALANAIAV